MQYFNARCFSSKAKIRYMTTLFTYHYKELIAHRNDIQIFRGIIIHYPCIYLCTFYIMFSVLASWGKNVESNPFHTPPPSPALIPLGVSHV